MKTLVRGLAVRRSTVRSAFVLVLITLPLWPALAQTSPAGAASQADTAAPPAGADPLGRSTPFGAVTGFVRAAERQDFALAAEYLETRMRGARAEELARQLHLVLNRGLSADLDRLSRVAEGNLQDGLPAARDRVGPVGLRSGGMEILVNRVERPDQPPIWLFAADTLALIPTAADELIAFDLEAYLPRTLVENTLLWQPLYWWITLPLFVGLAWLLGSMIARALLDLFGPLVRVIIGEPDGRTSTTITAPIRLILVALAIRSFSTISPTLPMRQLETRVAAVVAIIGLAWLVIRLSHIVIELRSRRLLQRHMLGRVAVVILLGRFFRAAVIVVAGLSLLYRAGVDLTAVLAGLGIGGIGLALAAQKTLENLLGGIMIISDEPVRVGDFCRVADQMGTVEDIGLRSTTIRTLSRTVVAVPNGQLASMNIENFSQRDKFWLHHTIGIRYETSADQLRYLLARVRSLLHAHPRVERDDARIRFVGFGASSMDLEVFAYVHAPDMAEFLAIQEDLLLRIMDLVAESGTGVAFPSQTTYVVRAKPVDGERREQAEAHVRTWRDRGELPFPHSGPRQAADLQVAVEYPPEGSVLRR